ncbi:hypothetical protein PG999_009994 [Apiospora kogelbergensis]|uniref:Protein kinase domain-containing protein n=1 Tax=Apiospora kogelbergensis TaxID=1337665 RepID=A0AAW0QVI8_9PEZI
MEFRITSHRTSVHDDDCLIVVRYVGAIFYLQWSPGDLDSAHTQDYLTHLRELRDEEGNHNGRLAELALPFEALMNQLAPTSVQAPFSLHDYLYPQWFVLKATAIEDNRNIEPVRVNETESPFCRPGVALHSKQMRELDLKSWVPKWYSSHEIELLADGERHPLLYSPSKVITKESQTECFFKGLGAGCKGTIHELVTFRAIDNAINRGALPSDIRICRLYGLVFDTFGPPHPEKRLVGMLLNYINPKQRGILGTLQCVAYDKHSHEHSRRWAHDLTEMVAALHRAGCVWGDAKPENVLIDNNDDVWLIDFGGGYTHGWVDEERQCTKEGDLGALEKIRQWLERLETNCQTV